jgi:hypothetical protein
VAKKLLRKRNLLSPTKTELLDRRPGCSFQALELALKMIGADLAFLNRKLDGQLRWESDANGDLGFPIPEAFRE